MYLSKDNIDALVIGEALSAMRALESGLATTVAVKQTPRINFEIHFPKNSAKLTDDSRSSLDELAQALQSDDYDSMRFVLGGTHGSGRGRRGQPAALRGSGADGQGLSRRAARP